MDSKLLICGKTKSRRRKLRQLYGTLVDILVRKNSHGNVGIQPLGNRLTKRNKEIMVEETGIHSSLTEDEIKQYLEQVIKEVKTRESLGNNR